MQKRRTEMDNTIVISTPPHVKSKRTTRSIMLDVLIALIPCAAVGVVYFGWQALVIELAAVLSCFLTEFVYYFIANGGFKNAKATANKFFGQFDLTSIVTGLILALILPTTDKWWEVAYEAAIGSAFAIALVKMLFGGTGKNIVNPAAAARVFMFVSFSLTTYVACGVSAMETIKSGVLETGATNLAGLLNKRESAYSLLDLFLGTGIAGCIGETSKAAILVGYVYLCARKVIKWWQPLLFIAALYAATVIACGFAGDAANSTGYYSKGQYGGFALNPATALSAVLSGGAIFGAVFMFTDYVTSPRNAYAQIVYYVAAAVLTAILRVATGIEVVSFVILLMNLLVPLIDKYVRPRPFGYVKPIKEGK